MRKASNRPGIIPLSGIEQASAEEWEQVMAIDGRGMFLTCKFAIEAMGPEGGSIICFSSISGLAGQSNQAVYGPAKFVASGLTKHLAVELAPRNIRVNAEPPGRSAPRPSPRCPRITSSRCEPPTRWGDWAPPSKASKGEPVADLLPPHLGKPHHHAYIVEEIETTVNRLVDQLGAGPFFLIEDVAMENVLSRGEPAEFAHNSAFGRCGTSVIELIEAVRLRPERVEKGFSGPRPRIHHIAYAVPSNQVTQLRSTLNERGLPEYLSAQLGEVDVTFHDASPVLGHDLEIHVDSQQLRDSFGMVSDAADGWDGSEPLRLLEG